MTTGSDVRLKDRFTEPQEGPPGALMRWGYVSSI
jgi:hypothetical protein